MESVSSIRLLVIFSLLICLKVSNADEENATATSDQHLTRPEITILQGPIRGVTMSTLKNRSIAGFLGIPYGQPPIGDLRFKAPVPAGAWNEILDAGSDSASCPHWFNGGVIGNEDCLYINVYTPQLPGDQDSGLLPVMIFIYGGGFIVGSNNSTNLGPGYLLDKDILLVVPNYRLGPLGFLSTGDAESPGNWGLKDQVLALEWVRDNIEFFGGDPKQVTIFGESAGSMSVNFLVLTNLTDGLFHRYITQSASALSTIAYQPSSTAIEYAIRLGEYLKCPTNTSALLIKCLRASDVSKILNTASLYNEWEIYPLISWAPTVEPDLEGAVLTDNPENLVRNGHLRDLPYMVGALSGDGIVATGYFYRHPDKFEEFLDAFDNILPHVLNYHDKVENVSAYTRALKSYYFNNDLTTNKTMILSNLTQLCSDLIANLPNYKQLQQASTNNSQYLYSFEYRGTYSYSYFYTSGLTENYGAAHSDELLYLFPQCQTVFGESASMSENDLKMVELMVELWTSFAITGKPVSTTLDSNKSCLPFSEGLMSLRIGNGAEVSLEVKDSGYYKHMPLF